jgi:hypothetical protein
MVRYIKSVIYPFKDFSQTKDKKRPTEEYLQHSFTGNVLRAEYSLSSRNQLFGQHVNFV